MGVPKSGGGGSQQLDDERHGGPPPPSKNPNLLRDPGNLRLCVTSYVGFRKDGPLLHEEAYRTPGPPPAAPGHSGPGNVKGALKERLHCRAVPRAAHESLVNTTSARWARLAGLRARTRRDARSANARNKGVSTFPPHLRNAYLLPF